MTRLSSLTTAAMATALPLTLFAQTADGPPGREQGLWQIAIMIAIFVTFFYFILLRPEQKRRKAQEMQRNALKKGDRVTAMGILGTVLRVQEHTVILKMYDGAKIEVVKGAITDIVPSNEEGDKSDLKDSKEG